MFNDSFVYHRRLQYAAGSSIQEWRSEFLARAHAANRTYREDAITTLRAHYDRIRLDNLDTYLPATHAQLDVALGNVAGLFVQASHSPATS